MKANKLKNGKFSINDLTEEDLHRLTRACYMSRTYLRNSTVPTGTRQAQLASRWKIEQEAAEFGNISATIRRALEQ